MHIVEVRRDGDALAGPMTEMRDWLDAHSIAPTLFKMSIALRNVVNRCTERLAKHADRINGARVRPAPCPSSCFRSAGRH